METRGLEGQEKHIQIIEFYVKIKLIQYDISLNFIGKNIRNMVTNLELFFYFIILNTDCSDRNRTIRNSKYHLFKKVMKSRELNCQNFIIRLSHSG